MEFDLFDLNTIVMNLLNEQSIGDHSSRSSSTVEHSNLSSSYEQQTSKMTTTTDCSRQYCLIIFNNSNWSKRLRKRSEQV